MHLHFISVLCKYARTYRRLTENEDKVHFPGLTGAAVPDLKTTPTCRMYVPNIVTCGATRFRSLWGRIWNLEFGICYPKYSTFYTQSPRPLPWRWQRHPSPGERSECPGRLFRLALWLHPPTHRPKYLAFTASFILLNISSHVDLSFCGGRQQLGCHGDRFGGASFISMSHGYAVYAHTAGEQPTPSTWQVTGCKFLCLANAAELA